MTSPAAILIDWGTSSFRAALVDGSGDTLQRHEGPRGILTVEHGDFAGALRVELGHWSGWEGLPILMAGMIGSKNGWIEAPYAVAPASFETLIDNTLHVERDGFRLAVLPGIQTTGRPPEVMRGEEVQIFGALADHDHKYRDKIEPNRDEVVFALPGTHSKWVRCVNGKIDSFATYMTGEYFQLSMTHSILGKLAKPSDEEDWIAFAEGVAEGAAPGRSGDLLNRLFRVRTSGLVDRFAPESLKDYLSGLLIGAEIDAAIAGDRPERVHIIANPALTDRYARAMTELGLDVVREGADVTMNGLLRAAKALGYVAT